MKEDNVGQATNDSLCDEALSHYERISQEVCSWNSLIPKAIEFYRSYLSAIKAGVPELGVSTGIHGELTYGYGKLDEHGFFEFDLTEKEYNAVKAFRSVMLALIVAEQRKNEEKDNKIREILAQPPDRISGIAIEEYAQIRDRILKLIDQNLKHN